MAKNQQENPDVQKTNLANDSIYSANSDTIFLSFGCGIAGWTSEELTAFENLSKTKNVDNIKSKLFSGTFTEQFLSAYILSEKYSKQTKGLTDSELARIEEIRHSKKTYSFCVGCTGQYEGSLEELFTNNNEIVGRRFLNSRLFDE